MPSIEPGHHRLTCRAVVILAEQAQGFAVTLALKVLFDDALKHRPRRRYRANRVAHDLSFMSSGEPKIAVADRFSTPRAASAHFKSRGPSTG